MSFALCLFSLRVSSRAAGKSDTKALTNTFIYKHEYTIHTQLNMYTHTHRHRYRHRHIHMHTMVLSMVCVVVWLVGSSEESKKLSWPCKVLDPRWEAHPTSRCTASQRRPNVRRLPHPCCSVLRWRVWRSVVTHQRRGSRT